jgi:putative thymidine phosphorylase
MDEISHERLGPVLTTYFAAAGFKEGFSPDELYFMTKAMVDTGKKLHFKGIVADKHSTGGVAGTRTTMILVPIVAAAGFLIPKNSSRAITAPAGTADTMEVVAPVTFETHEVEKIVEKVGGCIVWGGHLGLAPADDIIIEIEQPLAFESFDKVIVSIMAKKIAVGATDLIIDVPVGPTMKIQHFADAELIAKKFQFLAKKFDIRIDVDINEIRQNAGWGIGPVLEARDVFEVLEQKQNRPLALEAKALRLAGRLLNLCIADSKNYSGKNGEELAKELLMSGKALDKMREIIKAQGGNPDITSASLKPGIHVHEFLSPHHGIVTKIDNMQINMVCRILGCPTDKKAGICLHRKLEEHVDKGDILCSLFSSDQWRLKEAVETMKHVIVYSVA